VGVESLVVRNGLSAARQCCVVRMVPQLNLLVATDV
jgi:hypothetical protein